MKYIKRAQEKLDLLVNNTSVQQFSTFYIFQLNSIVGSCVMFGQLLPLKLLPSKF